MIKVVNLKDCCGCTACASVCIHRAITMEPDKLGFMYPKVDGERCVNCGLCESCCPIIARKKGLYDSEPTNWYAARNVNLNILFNSTSGGVFPALANKIIKDEGVVYGVAYTKQMEVIHTSAETVSDCLRFVGSKYVQSNLGGVYISIKNQLKNGKRVLFTGTPCQVEGLRSYLRRDYNNLILVDIICHAVPSPKVFHDFVEFVESKFGHKIVDIRMRDKRSHGWGHETSTRYVFDNGEQIVDPSGFTDWNSIYFSALVNRPSCSDCQFCNTHRPGDLTIGDFWDDDHKRPDLFNRNGTSIVMVNSLKGTEFLNSINDLSTWKIEKRDGMQYNLQYSSNDHPMSKSFVEDYVKHDFNYVYKKYIKKSLMRRIESRITNIIRRIIIKTICE